MDSRLRRIALLISLLFLAAIFVVVLYTNGLGPGQNREAMQTLTESESGEEPVVLEGQVGNDLYGWMSDDDFFDISREEAEQNALPGLSMIATSVEKDLRIKIVDEEGYPAEGEFFSVVLNGEDVYRDLDRDGMIYVADLKAGEYQVTLSEMEGYTVPSSPMSVTVKARVEYVAIGDISLLIKTEEEVDALAEDSSRREEPAAGSEPTDIRIGNQARFGIDVSKWNGEINWDKVKDAGVEYAIIRVGYRGSVTGSLIEDPFFRKNVEGASAAGIPIGVYFFTQAVTEVEAVEEASMVLELCKGYDLTYPIFIDTEGAGGNGRADALEVDTRTAVCQAFCETIRRAGKTAGIYASKNWFNNRLDISHLPENYVIWLAEYGDAPTYGADYHMWQYTSSGRITGIEGRVDLNLSYLELEEQSE